MERRELLGLTQTELAQKTGIDQGDISRIERGSISRTRRRSFALADALGRGVAGWSTRRRPESSSDPVSSNGESLDLNQVDASAHKARDASSWLRRSGTRPSKRAWSRRPLNGPYVPSSPSWDAPVAKADKLLEPFDDPIAGLCDTQTGDDARWEPTAGPGDRPVLCVRRLLSASGAQTSWNADHPASAAEQHTAPTGWCPHARQPIADDSDWSTTTDLAGHPVPENLAGQAMGQVGRRQDPRPVVDHQKIAAATLV